VVAEVAVQVVSGAIFVRLGGAPRRARAQSRAGTYGFGSEPTNVVFRNTHFDGSISAHDGGMRMYSAASFVRATWADMGGLERHLWSL